MKPRIYVETSVISYLAARPSRNALTAFRQQQTLVGKIGGRVRVGSIRFGSA